MTTLAAFRCPQCGANVDVEPGQPKVTCSYCGTVSEVQRAAAPVAAQPPATPPPAEPVAAVPGAEDPLSGPSRRTAIGCLLALVGMIAVIGVIAAVTAGSSDHHQLQYRQSPAYHPPATLWAEARFPPLVAQVVGGKRLLIGRIREGGGVAVAAFGFADGARVWTTPVDAMETPLRRAGDLVLIERSAGPVLALDLATGVRRWEVTLTDKLAAVCPSPDALWLQTVDLRWRPVSLAAGQIDPGAQAVGVGPPVECPEPPDPVPVEIERAHPALDFHVEVPGMSVGAVTREGDLALVQGRSRPGTPRPMMALLRGSQVLWSVERPTVKEEFGFGGLDDVRFVEGGVVTITFVPPTATLRYRRLTDGSVAWELRAGGVVGLDELQRGADGVYRSTYALEDRLLVVTGQQLQVVATTSGKVLLTIGG